MNLKKRTAALAVLALLALGALIGAVSPASAGGGPGSGGPQVNVTTVRQLQQLDNLAHVACHLPPASPIRARVEARYTALWSAYNANALSHGNATAEPVEVTMWRICPTPGGGVG